MAHPYCQFVNLFIVPFLEPVCQHHKNCVIIDNATVLPSQSGKEGRGSIVSQINFARAADRCDKQYAWNPDSADAGAVRASANVAPGWA